METRFLMTSRPSSAEAKLRSSALTERLLTDRPHCYEDASVVPVTDPRLLKKWKGSETISPLVCAKDCDPVDKSDERVSEDECKPALFNFGTLEPIDKRSPKIELRSLTEQRSVHMTASRRPSSLNHGCNVSNIPIAEEQPPLAPSPLVSLGPKKAAARLKALLPLREEADIAAIEMRKNRIQAVLALKESVDSILQREVIRQKNSMCSENVDLLVNEGGNPYEDARWKKVEEMRKSEILKNITLKKLRAKKIISNIESDIDELYKTQSLSLSGIAKPKSIESKKQAHINSKDPKFIVKKREKLIGDISKDIPASPSMRPPSLSATAPPPAISKSKLQLALNIHKESIIVPGPQRAAGREFSGPSFKVNPEKIIFNDFMMGVPQKVSVIITNVSPTLASFRVLPVEGKWRGWFEWQVEGGGRLAAGTQVNGELIFSPSEPPPPPSPPPPPPPPESVGKNKNSKTAPPAKKTSKEVPPPSPPPPPPPPPDQALPEFSATDTAENPEISTLFSLLTDTGRLDVPVTCFLKKKDIRIFEKGMDDNVSDLSICFGEVIRGEKSDRSLTIRNVGGSESLVSWENCNHLEFLSDDNSKITENKILINSRSEKSIVLRYTAINLGDFSDNFILLSDGKSLKTVKIRATVCPLPFGLMGGLCPGAIDGSLREYDLGVILFGGVYRETVRIRNDGKKEIKIFAELQNKSLPIDSLSAHPPWLNILPGKEGEFNIMIKLSEVQARTLTETQYDSNLTSSTTIAVSVPLKFRAQSFQLPLHANVNAKLCHGGVELSVKTIDFGDVVAKIGAHERDIKLMNKCALIQKFRIASIPEGMKIYRRPLSSDTGFKIPCVSGEILPGETLTLNVIYSPKYPIELDEEFAVKVVAGETSLAAFSYSVRVKGKGVKGLVKLDKTDLKLSKVPEEVCTTGNFEFTNRVEDNVFVKICSPPFESGLSFSPNFFRISGKKTQRVQVDFIPKKEIKIEQLVSPEKFDSNTSSKSSGSAKKTLKNIPPPPPPPPPPQPEPDWLCDTISGESGTVRTWKFPVLIGSDDPNRISEKIWISVQTVKVRPVLVSTREIDFGNVQVGSSESKKFHVEHVHELYQDQFLNLSLPLSKFSCFEVTNARRVVKFGGKLVPVNLKFSPDYERPFLSNLQLKSNDGIIQVVLRGKGLKPQIEIDNNFMEFPACSFSQKKTVKLTNPGDCNISFKISNQHDFFSISPKFGIIRPKSSFDFEVFFNPKDSCFGIFENKFVFEIASQNKEVSVSMSGKSFQRQLYCLRQEDNTFVESEAVFNMKPGETGKLLLGCMLVEYEASNLSYEIIWDATNPLAKTLVKATPGLKGPLVPGQELTINFEVNPSSKGKGQKATEIQQVSLSGKLMLNGGAVPKGDSPSREISLAINTQINNN